MKTAYDAAAEHMLAHTAGGGDVFGTNGRLAQPLELIQEGRGSFIGCLMSMGSIHKARATYYWLKDHNAHLVRYHASVAAKLGYVALDAQLKEDDLVNHGYVNLV